MTNGVVGVAVIQALMAGIGILIVGIPGAGLWTLLVLVLAVIQLPPFLVLVPIAVWVFFEQSTTPAVLFGIWTVIISVSDTFLRPYMLGRGGKVPMLVLLLGSFGGMMLSGIIGLFVGAVVLSLGYELFLAWLRRSALGNTEAGDAAE